MGILTHNFFFIVIPQLVNADEVAALLRGTTGLSSGIADPDAIAQKMIESFGSIGVKQALRIAERVLAETSVNEQNQEDSQMAALDSILDDIVWDGRYSQQVCEVDI